MDRAPRIAAIITTVQAPTAEVRAVTELTGAAAGRVVVIGDTKTPAAWTVPGVSYWSVEAQVSDPALASLARTLPLRHYARKNIGYLVAARDGAEWLYETDDDNRPLVPLVPPSLHMEPADRQVKGGGWRNVFRDFLPLGHDVVWPRGFPLERILDPDAELLSDAGVPSRAVVRVPVAQGVVNGDPDVDAVFRLTRPNRLEFAQGQPDLVLHEGAWSPFNSQNTWWHQSVIPLMYLPSTCTFRVTDILRSYVASAILERFGMGVRFTGPTAVQERNQHDLLADFRSEVPLYLAADELMRTVQASVGAADSMEDALRRAYTALAPTGVVTEAEVGIVDAWLDAITTVRRQRGD